MHTRFEPLITRSCTVVETEVSGEMVLMLADSGCCFRLGEFGTEVWAQLADSMRAATLIERLRDLYEAPAGVLERDVHELLASWTQAGLISLQHAQPQIYYGSSVYNSRQITGTAQLCVVAPPAA